MLKATKRKWLTFALCIIAMLLVLVIVSFFIPIYGEICSKSEYSGEKECATHYIATFVVLSVGEFLEAHDGAMVAIATIFIAAFTFNLKRSTDRLWKAGKKQIRLARDEFDATHRPRLAIRRVWAQLATNEAVNIEFTIVNTGEAPIVSWIWNAQILLLDVLGEVHFILTYDSKTQKSQVGPLEVGEGRVTTFVDHVSLDPSDFLKISRKSKFLHIVGFVAYVDKVGVTRRTGFFRFYDPDVHRFRLVYDSEYELEYQD
jgi:hypothetical protein